MIPVRYAAVRRRMQWAIGLFVLSLAFAAAWTVTSAMAAHLPHIVEEFGATPAQAVFAGMMIGPAQVSVRAFELVFGHRYSIMKSAVVGSVISTFGKGVQAPNASKPINARYFMGPKLITAATVAAAFDRKPESLSNSIHRHAAPESC